MILELILSTTSCVSLYVAFYFYKTGKNDFAKAIELDIVKKVNIELERKLEVCYSENSDLLREIGTLNERIISHEHLARQIEQNETRLRQELAIEREDQRKRLNDGFATIKDISVKSFAEVADRKSKEMNETFFKEWNDLQKHLGVIFDNLKKNDSALEAIQNVFKNANTSGQYSEFSLEVILQKMGFEKGLSYLTQTSNDGLRSDVCLLLPNGNQIDVWIIDCKSKQDFLQSTEDGLIKSFETSLSIFAKKDYETKIVDKIKQMSPQFEIGNVMKIMFLPFNEMILTIEKAKHELFEKARLDKIYIAGPSTIHHLLSLAQIYLGRYRFSVEFDKIKNEMKDFIQRLAATFGHIEETGKSLAQACKKFEDFGRSLNSRILPRARSLNKSLHAVDDVKLKNIPVFSFDKTIVDGVSEDVVQSDKLLDELV